MWKIDKKIKKDSLILQFGGIIRISNIANLEIQKTYHMEKS